LQTLAQLMQISAEFERHHPTDARSHLIAAYVQLYRGQRSAAAERVLSALEGAPNLARAYCLYGQVLSMANEPDAALEPLEMATRLSPRDGQLWTVQVSTALAHFTAERYAEAAIWAEAAARQAPGLPFTQAALASISAWAGDLDRARQALAELGALHPNMSVSGFGVITAATNPEIGKRFLDGLYRAGLPR
jgi:tetratricopeptide (TPR) repeat protein